MVNWIDIMLIIIFLLAIWMGWYRGFILGSLDLLTWVGSFVLGFRFYGNVSRLIDDLFNLGVWLLPLAFILTVLLARALIGLITRLIFRAVPDHVHGGGVNRFLGMIPGAINGWIYAVIASALLLALPLRDSITRETRESKLGVPLAMQSEWANKKLAPVFDEAVRHTMNSLMVNPASDETVSLGFTHKNPEVRPDLEARMLAMINRERAKHGLASLKPDPQMIAVARRHSKDMFARGYFSHDNPDGLDPFDRMRQANVQFLVAGENLALAQTLEIAHNNLMNSPGHRANILKPQFGRLGIGILDGGFYGLMISQEFRN